MSANNYNLKWTSHPSGIFEGITSLRSEDELFDMTLVCSDGQVQAHKVILSACSPFFHDLLVRHPHSHPLILLLGVGVRQLEAVLDFMYQGQVTVAQEELEKMLALASDLGVKGLTSDQGQPPKRSSGVPKQRRVKPAAKTFANLPADEDCENKEVKPSLDPESVVVKTVAQFDHEDIRDVDAEENYSLFDEESNINGEDVGAELLHGSDTQDNSFMLVDLNTGLSSDLVTLIKSKMEKLIGDNKVKLWHCTECSFKAKHKMSTFYHIETKHVESPGHVCPMCDKFCSSLNSLRQHQSKYKHRGINHVA